MPLIYLTDVGSNHTGNTKVLVNPDNINFVFPKTDAAYNKYSIVSFNRGGSINIKESQDEICKLILGGTCTQ